MLGYGFYISNNEDFIVGLYLIAFGIVIFFSNLRLIH